MNYVTYLPICVTHSSLKTLFLGVFILLQKYTGQGVVYWSMMSAKKWPIISSIISIIAAYLGTTLALRQANKKIKEIDY